MVKRVQKGIEINPRRDFHIEHYEIRSRNKMQS
jgi:hypothetical protein